jgi:hypothetical protein
MRKAHTILNWMLFHHCYAPVYYPKLLTLLLRRTAINEEGGYISGWVGAWRHFGYGVPELPPGYS